MSASLSIAFLPHRNLRDELFSPKAWQELASLGHVVSNEQETQNLDERVAKELLSSADVCITSWGSPSITEDLLDGAPRLRLHCHGAGSVKPFVSNAEFARPVIVTSAAAAIAVSVAETTLAWILIAAKRALFADRILRSGGWKDMLYPASDIRYKKIGLISASHVGQEVVTLLQPFEVNILLYDPYVSEEQAAKFGVQKVNLDELMSQSDVISLHAPKTDETTHMINAVNLALMKDGATLINTARGQLIDEDALVDELRTGRIWAVLDVTEPEPPATNHPLRSLPNVTLTPHIAGCVGAGRLRIGDYVVRNRRFAAGEPQRYAVTADMLPRIG